MGCNYGSIWRKWDFHVHTPYSILNNNYGFNPFELQGEALEQAFDEFVRKLLLDAVTNDISAIGITDYFMIEGYKEIKRFLKDPKKMQKYFPDEELRRKVEEIYVFPNIEMRLDTFVGEGSSSINYHIMFSDEVSETDIQQNFLNRLEFKFDAYENRSLTKENIIEFGKKIKVSNGNPGSELLVGLQNVTVSYNSILKTLRTSSFKGLYLIAIPVDADLTKISWSGRDYSTRLNLYKQADVYLTANKSTRKWALAEGEEEDRIREFGSIKPCIWGSDSHGYGNLFKPSEDRYCWVKSEPSFNGLKQILYEPGTRVRIQKNQPLEKDAHQIIDHVQFSDTNFQKEAVVFNDSLTCIIGGKSTGKSLLLRSLAKAIDSQYYENQENESSPIRKSFDISGVKVFWKDGTTDSRKIVYIPQTYLNKTIDNPQEQTAISKIIENVLLQEADINQAYNEFKTNLTKIKQKTQDDVRTFMEMTSKLAAVREEIKKEGASETFNETIKTLDDERTTLVGSEDVSPKDVERFAELEKKILTTNSVITTLKEEKHKLDELRLPSIVIPGYFHSIDSYNIGHNLNEDFPQSASALIDLIAKTNNVVSSFWTPKIEGIKSKILTEINDSKNVLDTFQSGYDRLKEKVVRSEQLQKLTNRIREERNKLERAKERESRQNNYLSKIDELSNDILESQSKYRAAYEKYANAIRNTRKGLDTELDFDAAVVWKREQFVEALSTMFNKKNYSSFKNVYGSNLAELKDDDYGKKLLKSIWDAIENPNERGGLMMKVASSKEDVLTRLFDDWFNIHYVVKSGNDTIENMSPGKKALVLLELLIDRDQNKCPILIDQPEDDLDNRSIYHDLVQFIRKKKEERQIIVVTHNANIVLGADAEEVIIANQDGQGTENVNSRFEYRSGAIENDEIPKDESGKKLPGILNKTGIQTQICDILEGGKDAFQLRQHKYSSINH